MVNNLIKKYLWKSEVRKVRNTVKKVILLKKGIINFCMSLFIKKENKKENVYLLKKKQIKGYKIIKRNYHQTNVNLVWEKGRILGEKMLGKGIGSHRVKSLLKGNQNLIMSKKNYSVDMIFGKDKKKNFLLEKQENILKDCEPTYLEPAGRDSKDIKACFNQGHTMEMEVIKWDVKVKMHQLTSKKELYGTELGYYKNNDKGLSLYEAQEYTKDLEGKSKFEVDKWREDVIDMAKEDKRNLIGQNNIEKELKEIDKIPTIFYNSLERGTDIRYTKYFRHLD